MYVMYVWYVWCPVTVLDRVYVDLHSLLYYVNMLICIPYLVFLALYVNLAQSPGCSVHAPGLDTCCELAGTCNHLHIYIRLRNLLGAPSPRGLRLYGAPIGHTEDLGALPL